MEMNSARILVVEDESIVAMDICNCLTGHGYHVVASLPSGEEAIALVSESRPDLVLMDIRLQGEMNGIEAARRIMELFQVPSLFLTSYVDRDMLAQAKGLNALGYLLKPFEDRELGVAVEMALHRWEVEAGLRRRLDQATGAREDAAACAPEMPALRIRTLGQVELLMGEKVVARAEDLSRSLRNLLGLLVASPQMRMSKDDIQLALWPESSPEKARSSFDSLLLRLRKTLDALIRPHSIGHHLLLQRGILCLNDCLVDAVEFRTAAGRGIDRLRRKDSAGARAAFAEALQWWGGPFLPGTSEIERLHDFREGLERLYVESVLRLSDLLLAEGESEEASRILTQALPYDRVNDDLVRALHQSYLSANNPAKAAEVIRLYREALWRAGFSTAEIREALESLSRA